LTIPSSTELAAHALATKSIKPMKPIRNDLSKSIKNIPFSCLLRAQELCHNIQSANSYKASLIPRNFLVSHHAAIASWEWPGMTVLLWHT
jgi:hypothetical protein